MLSFGLVNELVTPSVQTDRFSLENLCVRYTLKTLILIVVVVVQPQLSPVTIIVTVDVSLVFLF
jgi:hypothetical protein